MSILTIANGVRKLLLPGAFAAALAAMIGFQASAVSAQPAARTWSIVVHFVYQDGFEYDYVIASGVTVENIPSMLAEYGRSHSTGSVVRYHCFATPE